MSAASGEEVEGRTEYQGQDVNVQMLSLLQNMSGKMDSLSSRVNTLETSTQSADSALQPTTVPAAVMSDQIIPSLDSLRSFPEVQQQVVSLWSGSFALS